MNNTTDYIATSSIFHPTLLLFSEFLTIAIGLWVLYEVIKLCLFFAKHFKDSFLSRLLTWTFVAKGLTVVVIILMGYFLFLNKAEGVKALVIIRPLIEIFGAIAFRRLRKYYERAI